MGEFIILCLSIVLPCLIVFGLACGFVYLCWTWAEKASAKRKAIRASIAAKPH